VKTTVGKPIIAITMGDAAGIGPELIVKLLSDRSVHKRCAPVVVGDPETLRKNATILGADLHFAAVERLSDARFSPEVIDVLQPAGLRIGSIPWGRMNAATGRAAAMCLQHAFQLAMEDKVHGVVSAPLNKEAFHLAGYEFFDELAFLADLTHSTETFTLGVASSIWTIALAEHVPFAEIAGKITRTKVLWCIHKMHGALEKAGFAAHRIGVAALNVHGGEGGLFGHEEIDEIEPAIQEVRQRGIMVQGPVPADVIFVRALAGDFDGLVYMYHDQANIARKLQPRLAGATLLMGLPVVCGTTAHGTAFDVAGKGIADPGSLHAALEYTIRLSTESATQA